MTATRTDERGAAALLVAAMLVFLMGAAALAVDLSGFQADARGAQTTADLACLAGVAELPDDPNLAITTAATYAQRNWPGMSGATLTVIGNQGTLVDGSGNAVLFEVGLGGDDGAMRVAVVEEAATSFGRVLGAQSVTISREAFCQAEQVGGSSGGGMLPFGAPTGGFGGSLQIGPPCGNQNGNCGALSIPRDDASGTGPTLINNIANGADRDLQAWLGSSSGAVDCDDVGSGETCHIIATDTGVSASHLGNGFYNRLAGEPGSCTFSYRGGTLNCDSAAQILGGTPTPLMSEFASQPDWWDPRLYGTYNSANTAQHYWWNAPIAKCDSPRHASVPIVTEEMDWDLGDAHEGWPTGKKDVKVVGRYDVIVVEPNSSSDFQGNKNLKQASAIVVWYGENAACADGSGPFGSLSNPTGSQTSVKLVAGDG